MVEEGDESLLFIKQAIRCIYECTPHQPLATGTPLLCALPNYPSVQSFKWHTLTILFWAKYIVQNSECPLWKAALGEIWEMFTQSEQRQEAIREQSTQLKHNCISVSQRVLWTTISKPGFHFTDYQHLILGLTKQSSDSLFAK